MTKWCFKCILLVIKLFLVGKRQQQKRQTHTNTQNVMYLVKCSAHRTRTRRMVQRKLADATWVHSSFRTYVIYTRFFYLFLLRWRDGGGSPSDAHIVLRNYFTTNENQYNSKSIKYPIITWMPWCETKSRSATATSQKQNCFWLKYQQQQQCASLVTGVLILRWQLHWK